MFSPGLQIHPAISDFLYTGRIYTNAHYELHCQNFWNHPSTLIWQFRMLQFVMLVSIKKTITESVRLCMSFNENVEYFSYWHFSRGLYKAFRCNLFNCPVSIELLQGGLRIERE